jgi:MFS family permease
MTRSPAHTAMVALAATLAIQIFTSLTATAPSVLASELAPDIGITPRLIGVFVGLVYAGAMLGSLLCGTFIARFGSIRVSQACVLLCSLALMLVAVLPATAAWVLVGAAFLLGLGYGPVTPASSDVLIRTTTPSQMALTFSIKQTGVPAGAAIAGALLPSLALLAGWRGAFLVIAVIGVAVAIAAQPTRNALDIHHSPDKPFAWSDIFGPLKIVLSTPALRGLALTGSALSAVQVCLTTYLVVYLNDTLQWSLVAAGLALTAATLSAMAGRIFWGVLADRWLAPRLVLVIIGTIACACGLLLALATPAWPTWTILAIAVLYGGSAIGWNGVQLSELARQAPPGTAGAVTGASGFITFAGVVAGPAFFAAIAAATSSYRSGFIGAAAVSGLAAATLIARGARAAHRNGNDFR